MTRKSGGKQVSSRSGAPQRRAPPRLREKLNVKTRVAIPSDLEAITQIYNEAIVTTTATFDTEPQTAIE